MLIPFFYLLRDGGMKPSITELLTLLEAMQKGVAGQSVDDFYFLARACLVKDESKLDLFDRLFASYFNGVEDSFADLMSDVPEEWLRFQAELMLSEEERARIEALGGFEELMKALQERLEEQDERHEGGNKWIGTAGTSPFGAYGYNPEGVRIGQQGSRNRSAVKVWDRREYRNLDDTVELGTRNIKVALRRLRKFAREGAADQLDLDDTIDKTARNAGLLDIRMVPERHNAVKVLALPRYRRLYGRSCSRLRGVVFRIAQRVQTPRVFLFPQFCLRKPVEGQSSPPCGTHSEWLISRTSTVPTTN